MSDPLLDHHRKFLRDRAVSDETAAQRGYESVTVPGAIRAHGFSRTVAALVPGLAYPVRDYSGQVRFWTYRPDRPRVLRDRPVKYEVPRGTQLVVDVPPAAQPAVADPEVPLFITESPVKADSAVSHGIMCAGLFGAMGWRGTNKFGGKTSLADFEHFALNGRLVYLVPDSDVQVNANVAASVRRLGALLGSYGARVRYVYLPHPGLE